MKLKGFPVSLLSHVRCNKDAGILAVDEKASAGAKFIINGVVHCLDCGARYSIEEGILDLLEIATLQDERSQLEIQVRDAKAKTEVSPQNRGIDDILEMETSLVCLGMGAGRIILELGCGTGRFTRQLAQRFDAVLALDFSMESLRANILTLASERDNVGFVRADINQLRLKSASFDAALSTLYSNLPTREMRMTCTKIVHDALKPKGRYVMSAHHQHLRRVLKRLPMADRYKNGIFYQNFTKASLKQELALYFPHASLNSICISLPGISRFHRLSVLGSRIASRLPLFNRLGVLLLASATRA